MQLNTTLRSPTNWAPRSPSNTRHPARAGSSSATTVSMSSKAYWLTSVDATKYDLKRLDDPGRRLYNARGILAGGGLPRKWTLVQSKSVVRVFRVASGLRASPHSGNLSDRHRLSPSAAAGSQRRTGPGGRDRDRCASG